MIKRNIPNAITCGNLLCGCLAIVCAFNGNLIWASYLVGIAAVLDFLDGFAARMLKVHSEIGKQLDSLADMVTFGVVPGVIMFHLIQYALVFDVISNADPELLMGAGAISFTHWTFIPFIAFLIPVFSALRLAKFNIDTRQSDSFIGVPTPANSILIASFPLILGVENYSIGGFSGLFAGYQPGEYHMGEYIMASTTLSGSIGTIPLLIQILINPWFLLGITVLMSFLLVAELPLFALKFKHFKWKGNEIRFIFLGLSVLLLVFFQFTGIPFIIFLYVILSVINNIGKKKKEQDYDLIAKK
jgi:CDP-diacylglycerol---serine O-phosphatidyltransferase